MSVKDRMAKMKGILAVGGDKQDLQSIATNEITKPIVAKSGTQTAPGGMLAFRSQLQQHEATVKSLEAKLAQFTDGVRTIKLDPSLVDESKWANRHSSSFDTDAFDKFKDEIAHASGNIQPILVRPVGSRYEVVFGHRRLTACKQLGLPVLAMIMEMPDEELFALMDRENRERVDLTPYEQGEMWRKALDHELFSSARQLASSVGIAHTTVNQYLDVARLPEYVLELFPSPTEVQVRWAKALKNVLQTDPEAVAGRAAKIKALGSALPSIKIFEMLITDEPPAKKAPSMPIKYGGKVIGKISRSKEGDVSLSIKAGFLSDIAFAQLNEELKKLIGS